MMRRTLLAAALGGCSVLPQRPYLVRRQWPLAARRPVALPPRRGGAVLLVRTITAAPGLEERGFRRLQPDGSVTIDFYEEWVVPPSAALEDSLRLWLAESGLFAAVTGPGSRARADWVLEGELTQFQAGTGAFRAATALVAVDLHPGPRRFLAQPQIETNEPLPKPDAPSVALSGNAALAALCAAIEMRLAAAA